MNLEKLSEIEILIVIRRRPNDYLFIAELTLVLAQVQKVQPCTDVQMRMLRRHHNLRHFIFVQSRKTETPCHAWWGEGYEKRV